MRKPPVPRIVLAACIVAATFGAASPSAGAPKHRGSEGPFETADTSWEGTSDLVALAIERLGRERVRVAATLDYGELTEADGVLLLHPETEVSFEEMSRFLRSGGRLAVLDDFGTGDRLLDRFNIRRIAAPRRPLHVLRGNPALAVAVPSVEMVAGVERGRHPIAAQVEQVITNHPTGLSHRALTPVLEIPSAEGAAVPLAVTGIIANRGRMLAMGDPSVFINLMLRYPGNRGLAEGVVDYLVGEDDWGPRGGRLFIVSNQFRQTGRFGNRSGWADDLVERWRDMQEEFSGWRDGGIPDRAAWTLAWAIAALSGLWLVWHAARHRRPLVPRFARPVAAAAQAGLPGRASVLAAPTTAPALPLLELKGALQQVLARQLGAPLSTSLGDLCERCRKHRLLAPPDQELLSAAAARLQRVEEALLRGSPPKLREAELEEWHKNVLSLVGKLRGARPWPPPPGPPGAAPPGAAPPGAAPPGAGPAVAGGAKAPGPPRVVP
jgi:hypothetical protein